MVGGAVGHWNGQTAFAMGLSHASDDGRVIFKAAGSINTRGNAGGNVGAGFSF
jgi:autotransporter adhesin